MKTKITLFFILFGIFNNNLKAQSYSYTVFNEILFYDGYAAVVSDPVPQDVIRHSNDLYAKKLPESVLASFGA